MRIAKWLKTAGSKVGQETADEKRCEGLAYIEKLKKEDKVISVEETEQEFVITLE